MRRHFFRSVVILSSVAVLLVSGPVSADETQVFSLNGYGHVQIGQVVKGRASSTMDHQWMTTGLVGLSATAQPSERLNVVVSPEFKLFFPYPELNNLATRRSQAVAYINELNGNLAFGNIEKPLVEYRLGIFNYKYNPDVKDLGEYLFRTGTYPPYMINNFDYAKARLFGMVLRVNPIEDLKIDAILNSELQYYPLYDFSLSFIGEYTLLKAFNIGAGVDFARLIPVDPNKTSPSENTLNVTIRDALAIQYKENESDTGYSGLYSFKATKLMARLSIDPKAFFPNVSIFGKEDLKLYGEIAVTGLPIKTVPDSAHPALYSDLSRLMPMMVGFNFPAFKVLDVLSVEFEYFPSRMPNDYYTVVNYSVPLPHNIGIDPPSPSSYDPKNYQERDIAWAIYAAKEVVKGFSLIGQIAYDHMRMPYTDGYETTYECMNKRGDWAWQAKAMYSF